MTTDRYEPERFRSPEYLGVLDTALSDLSLTIPAACLSAIKVQGESGYPHEICGLLIGTVDAKGWHVCEVRQVENLNRERAADRFEIDPAAYQKIDRELRGTRTEIIGVYHSHPDCPAKPSPTDLGNAWEGFAYPIVSICDGKAGDIHCWSLNSRGSHFQQNKVIETS